MPETINGAKKVQVTLKLPADTVEKIDALIPHGYHGTNRAEAIRQLLRDALWAVKQSKALE